MKNERSGNPSLHRLLDILELLSTCPDLGMSDISRRLNMNRTTAYNTISVLADRGYVIKDVGGGYQLTGKTLEIGSKYVSSKLPFSRTFVEYTKTFAKMHPDYSVSLSVIGGPHHATVVKCVNSISRSTTVVPPGYCIPMHASSAGKLLLAYSSDDFQKNYFETADLEIYTPNTISTVIRLKEQLKLIRLLGYAVDKEELYLGNSCAAVPVFDKISGEISAAISISAPADTFNSEEGAIVKALINFCKIISG